MADPGDRLLPIIPKPLSLLPLLAADAAAAAAAAGRLPAKAASASAMVWIKIESNNAI